MPNLENKPYRNNGNITISLKKNFKLEIYNLYKNGEKSKVFDKVTIKNKLLRRILRFNKKQMKFSLGEVYVKNTVNKIVKVKIVKCF